MLYIGVLIALYLICYMRGRCSSHVSVIIFSLYFIFSYLNGADWLNYYDLYNNYECCEAVNGWYEPGFLLLIKFCQVVGLSYLLFSLLLSLIICLFLSIYAYKSKNPSITFFILFSTIGYYAFQDQYRQGIALSIFAYSLTKTSIPIKILCCLIAMSFHVSALCGLLLIFDNKFENYNSYIVKYKKITLYLIGIIFLYILCTFNFSVYLNNNFKIEDVLSPGRFPYFALIILSLFYIRVFKIKQKIEFILIYFLSYLGQIYRLSYYMWIDLASSVGNSLGGIKPIKKFIFLTLFIPIGLIPLGNDLHRYIIFNQYNIFSDITPDEVAKERCKFIMDIKQDDWILDACSKY